MKNDKKKKETTKKRQRKKDTSKKEATKTRRNKIKGNENRDNARKGNEPHFLEGHLPSTSNQGPPKYLKRGTCKAAFQVPQNRYLEDAAAYGKRPF